MIFWLLHPLLRDFTLVDVNPDVKTETAATFSKVLKLREISTAAQPIMINHRNRPFQNHEHIISIWKSRCYFFSRVVSHSISYKFRGKMSRSCRLIVLHYHSARGCLNYCLESLYWRTPKCWLASIQYEKVDVIFSLALYSTQLSISLGGKCLVAIAMCII